MLSWIINSKIITYSFMVVLMIGGAFISVFKMGRRAEKTDRTEAERNSHEQVSQEAVDRDRSPDAVTERLRKAGLL